MLSDGTAMSTLLDRNRKLTRTPSTADVVAMKTILSHYKHNGVFNEAAYRPSVSAALIITAPLQLLNIALGSLLAGFGIYFGFVYSAKLAAIEDNHSALAVLVVYIASATSGLIFFYLPVLIKRAAKVHDQKGGNDVAALFDTLEIAIQAAQQAEGASKQDSVLSALNQFVSLQEKQLQDAASKQDDVLSARLIRSSASRRSSYRNQPPSKMMYCLRLPGSSALKRSS
jgi:hypothetical protein